MGVSKGDAQLRATAKRHGANYALAIIREARRAGLQVKLGFALIEQESNFANVWGHDAAPNGGTSHLGGKRVTKKNYLEYKRRRGSRGQGGMNGVGPAQLTWWQYQDRADRIGGCWIARHNIRIAFELLDQLIAQHGERKGLAVYNGGMSNPNYAYADQVLARKRKWHDRFT